MTALLARIAMLRAFNRRAKYALPWLPLRPAQENSAVLGGLSGIGASVQRAGKSGSTHQMEMVRCGIFLVLPFSFILTHVASNFLHQWFQASSIGGRIRSC